jgi:phage tail-like protein
MAMGDTQPRAASRARREMPFPNCNFHVEIEGVTSGGFSEVDIEPARICVIRYRDGSDLGERMIPGQPEPGRLELTRGLTDDRSLFQWWRKSREGDPHRVALVVMLLDEQRQPGVRWLFRHAWPVAYALGRLDAEGEEPMTESVSVVFSEMEVE